jgi:hypothetical protein
MLLQEALRSAGVPGLIVKWEQPTRVDYSEPAAAAAGDAHALETMVKEVIGSTKQPLVDFRNSREKYKAHIGILIVHQDGNGDCGWAGGIGAEPKKAFVVVNWKCMTSKFSFVHEIGHLLGANHQSVTPETQPLYARAFVYDVAPAPFVDVMGYEIECDKTHLCVREPYFSNPTTTIRNIVIGVADKIDNARSVRDHLAIMLSAP